MFNDLTNDGTEKQIQLGVLIKNMHIRTMLSQIPVTRFQRLQDANRGFDINLFFFSLIQVDLENQLIKGVFFDKKDHLWKEGSFSFPDVFYYCGGIPKRMRLMYLQFIDTLKENGCQFINHTMGFDKWDIYKLIAQNAETRPFLPETKLYSDVNTLKDMLNVYGTVYLKGCKGQKGEQVIRVRKISANWYEYRYSKNRLRVGKVHLRSLIKLLSVFFKNKMFVIQQGISLREIGGRKIDMRAEMQRTANGELVVTGIAVRLGRVGSPVTIHSSSYRFIDYLAVIGSEINNISERKVTDFLYRIYSAVEAGYGRLGELGIDFALDTKGRLWFIECNSHPTKVSLMKAYDKMTVNQAFSNTLAYARFLTSSS